MIKSNFDYQEIENDSTKEEVLSTEELLNYDKTTFLSFDSSFEEFYNSLCKTDIFSKINFQMAKTSKNDLQKTISLWKDFNIQIHPIQILDNNYVFKENEEDFEITEEFENAIHEDLPFSLPISFFHSKMKLNGKLNYVILPGNELEKTQLLYQKIRLVKKNPIVTSSIYHHEITHTQINDGRTCKNLLDTETIPTFIGELFASKIDPSLTTLKNFRLANLENIFCYLQIYRNFKNIAYSSKIELDTYIKSILQAIWLMNQYLEGNSNKKKEILQFINKIFEGEKTVQEMLDYYDSNMEEVPKDLKQLILK